MKGKTLYDKYMKDKEFERLMAQEDLIMEVTEGFCKVLEEKAIKRTTLAELMGKTKGYISQLLNGRRNITLRSLSDIAHCLGYNVKVSFKEKRIKKEKNIVVLDWPVGRKSKFALKDTNVTDDYHYVSDKTAQLGG